MPRARLRVMQDRRGCRENGGVGQASAFVDRTITAGRRIARSPEWPLYAAMLLGSVGMIEVLIRGTDTDSAPTVPLLLSIGATMPLAFARAHVLPAAAAIGAATLLTLATDNPVTGAALVALTTASYLVGLCHSRRAATLLTLPWLGNAVWSPFSAGTAGRSFAVLLFAIVFTATAVGAARRSRAEAARRDASRQEIEETLLDHAARGERARIARELHDVVAHHISMIAVQAETARLTTPGMPAEGARRLVAIGDTARAALTEMRRLLGVLREDAGTEPSRAPQPGLEQLNSLIDEARESAGAGTRLIVHGSVVPLDPGVQLTAYRIIQEALTNTRRHAPGAAVDVELGYLDGALKIRIRDNGPGPPRDTVPVAGHGLPGMRERAGMVGGTLRAGGAPMGGFLVEATLPIAEAR
jgi:signal transduction histidine kinase